MLGFARIRPGIKGLSSRVRVLGNVAKVICSDARIDIHGIVHELKVEADKRKNSEEGSCFSLFCGIAPAWVRGTETFTYWALGACGTFPGSVPRTRTQLWQSGAGRCNEGQSVEEAWQIAHLLEDFLARVEEDSEADLSSFYVRDWSLDVIINAIKDDGAPVHDSVVLALELA